jgi:sortase A
MRFLPILGKFLISVGVGVLMFVAWTLWGTGIATHRAQNNLLDEFASLPPFKANAAESPTKPHGPPKSFKPGPGDGVFLIKIPKVELNDDKGYMVVEGVTDEDLAKGPGHYPSCGPEFGHPLCTELPEVWPGEKGRVIVSGHRTTHGAPFYDINELQKGDEIFIESRWGDFTYTVTKQEIVLPNAIGIANPAASTDAELVLTTCNPRFSAAERLVVFAELTDWSNPN